MSRVRVPPLRRVIVKDVDDILYERVVRSLIHESRTDSIARIIVKNIVNMISSRLDRINDKKKYACVIRNVWPGRDEFIVRLNVRLKDDIEDQTNVAGHWTPGMNMLTVDVYIDAQFGLIDKRVLSAVQGKAYDTVRHELEHDVQPLDVMSVEEDKEDDDPSALWSDVVWLQEYFMSKHEVAAYVAGLHHKAKRLRRPFVEVMDEKLNAYKVVAKHYNKVDDVDAIFKEIRRVWLDYARRRFPDAIVT